MTPLFGSGSRSARRLAQLEDQAGNRAGPNIQQVSGVTAEVDFRRGRRQDGRQVRCSRCYQENHFNRADPISKGWPSLRSGHLGEAAASTTLTNGPASLRRNVSRETAAPAWQETLSSDL